MQLEGDAPLMATMARYHLGLVDPAGKPTPRDERSAVQGKRIRPQLAFQCCASVGGDPAMAAPLAAAIELLHNFTLIHDDIQDRSPNRRHRATVWRVWGDAQAINAGDALFAMAQRTLLRTDAERVSATTLLRLMDEFNRVTIEIVRGQVLDLEFERMATVEPDRYLAMIKGKTAAIVRFAAWAGAIVGGASESTAAQLAQFGESLGIGFQVQDDVLGIWGSLEATGKDPADDIRRRKKSLPILMLLERATPQELTGLMALYNGEKINEHGVSTVLGLLEKHGIREAATAQVTAFHRQAEASLALALGVDATESGAPLGELIRRLDTRIS
jgi:geranylgeranyl diphosphate synthase type I